MLPFAPLAGRTTFIVGNGKNSGKTTFLNLAAAHLRAHGPVALASVGVDGEPEDLVFGHAKPAVPVAEGDLLLTTDTALRASSGRFTLLHVFPYPSVLGRLVLARAQRAATVELIGPGPNAHLAEALGLLRAEHGATTVLVDGAADRVTQVAVPDALDAQLVEVVRATPETRLKAAERLAFLARILTLGPPPADLAPTDAGVVTFPGALTEARLAALPTTGLRALIVRDFTRLFVPARALARLPAPLFVERVLPVAAVVLNTFGVDPATLLTPFATTALAARVWHNPFADRVRAASVPAAA